MKQPNEFQQTPECKARAMNGDYEDLNDMEEL